MTKRTHITAAGKNFAASAAHDLAQLKRAMKAAEDSLAGLNRAIHVPTPKGSSRYIKGSRSSPSIFLRAAESGFGNFFANSILSGVGLSHGYGSASQISSLWSDILQQGQRNK